MHSLKEEFTCGTLRERDLFDTSEDSGTGILGLLDWLENHQNDKKCYFNNVLHHVLIHPHTPLDLLEKLATDKSNEIRYGVADNPSTPIILLQQLANDEDKDVRSVAYTNLNKIKTSPSYTLEQRKAILNNLANTNEPSLSRLAVLLSDYAKESLLVSNFSSPSWLERYAIAQNTNTSSDILKHLEKDGNRIVRAAARANQRRRQESE